MASSIWEQLFGSMGRDYGDYALYPPDFRGVPRSLYDPQQPDVSMRLDTPQLQLPPLPPGYGPQGAPAIPRGGYGGRMGQPSISPDLLPAQQPLVGSPGMPVFSHDLPTPPLSGPGYPSVVGPPPQQRGAPLPITPPPPTIALPPPIAPAAAPAAPSPEPRRNEVTGIRDNSFLHRILKRGAVRDENGDILLWPTLRDSVLPEIPDPNNPGMTLAGTPIGGGTSPAAESLPATTAGLGGYSPVPRPNVSTRAPYSPMLGGYNVGPADTTDTTVRDVPTVKVAGTPADTSLSPTPPPQGPGVQGPGGPGVPQQGPGVQAPGVPQGARAQVGGGPAPQQGGGQGYAGVPSSPIAPQGNPSFFDRASAFVHNLGNPGLIPAMFDAAHGAATGQRLDPQGMQLAAMNNTYHALLSRGWQPDMAMAGATNGEVLKGMLAPPTWGIIREDDYGKHYGYIWPQSVMMQLGNRQGPAPQGGGGPGGPAAGGGVPFAGQESGAGTGGIGGDIPPEALAKGARYDDTLKGEPWLQQFNPEVQGFTRAWLGGDAMPTTRGGNSGGLSALGKKLAQRYAIDTTGQPLSDTDFAARRKLKVGLTSTENNTAGGIMLNGNSATGHLADASDSLVALHNRSGPDIPGGAWLGEAANIAKNVLGRTPKQDYALKAAKGWLLKYGQEGTKFYAGTGGGEGERTAAIHENNPDSATSQALAGFLQQERDAMVERFRGVEEHIKKNLGADYLKQNPVFTKELNAKLARIDANIATLRGDAAPAPASTTRTANGLPPLPHGFTLQE